jgi:hypothetical protein
MSGGFIIVPGAGAISTAGTVITGTSTSTSSGTSYGYGVVPNPPHTPRAQTSSSDAKKLESGVYGYIRAIRAMGRTSVNTVEIAQALKVSVEDVERTLVALEKKGVKVA